MKYDENNSTESLKKKHAHPVQNNQKTAGNNQWVSTGRKPSPDTRERRDGPGGEDARK